VLGVSAIRKRPWAEDRTRPTSRCVVSRRIVIDVRYGLSQVLPGRSTGQVGPISTLPVMPESGCRTRKSACSIVNPDPPQPPANTDVHPSTATIAWRRLFARVHHIMNPASKVVNAARLKTALPQRERDRGGSSRYGAATFSTRVPQFLRPSGVWLDFGGTYSVASQIDFPLGSITAHE
jgi:hypothetical protein